MSNFGTHGEEALGELNIAGRGRLGGNYYCTTAMTSRARCAYYNGHATRKLEAAILEHLGQYSDPKKVRELLDASEKQEVRRRAAELKSVERCLAEVEADFAKNLELLKRDVLDEAEFRKANEARRDERTRLTGRQTELTAWQPSRRPFRCELAPLRFDLLAIIRYHRGEPVPRDLNPLPAV